MHPASFRRVWRNAAVLVLAVALVYANSFSGPFVLDDHDSIVNNGTLRDWTNLAHVFAQPRNTPLAGRPVVAFTFALNYGASGLGVEAYHLTNLAIHALCALLLFGIVRRTLMLPEVAFAVALLWAVHPLNTEVMDYVTQRTESLMALFLLLSLYAAIRSATSPRKVLWQCVAASACALGMLCKESMVVAPVLIVLYDRVFLFDSLGKAFAARWRLYGGLALTWVALLYMMAPGPRASTVGFTTAVTPWNYLLNQPVMIARYLRLAFWPQGLVVDYGPPVARPLMDVVPQAILVIGLVTATLLALRWRPAVGFLGAWIFITLAPTSTFVPIATEVGAERRMYLPLMAIAVLLVVPAFNLLKRRAPGTAATAALTVAAVALGSATVARNRDYASELSLAESTLRHWPTDVAHGMVGSALTQAHRDDEAIKELRVAARSDPRSRYNLGVALYNTKRFDEAIRELETFAGENPTLDMVPSSRRILGDAFAIQRNWAQAANEYRLALSMIPNDPDTKRKLSNALNNQGIALADAARFDEAAAMFRRALESDPANWSARHNLAAALLDRHDPEGAEMEARKATAFDPTDAGTHQLLGRALAIQRKYDEAIAEFREALKLAPGDEQITDDLRRVLAVRRE